MLLSISEASRMVGIKSRSTFYRHIEKKGISTIKDDDGNPKIDISELIRVYGSRVQRLEEGADQNSKDTPRTIQMKHDHTPGSMPIEIQVLRERLKNLEENKKSNEEERRKESNLLSDQIETLRTALSESQEQQKRLTLMITDQSEGKKGRDDVQEQRIKNLEAVIDNLKAQNERLFQLEEERRKRAQERRKQRESEKKKTLLGRIFGTGG